MQVCRESLNYYIRMFSHSNFKFDVIIWIWRHNLNIGINVMFWSSIWTRSCVRSRSLLSYVKMTCKNVCCVDGCDNNQMKPEELVIKPHVKQLRWHRIPRPSSKKNKEKRKAWIMMIAKGRKRFNPGNGNLCVRIISSMENRPRDIRIQPSLWYQLHQCIENRRHFKSTDKCLALSEKFSCQTHFELSSSAVTYF